MRSGRISVVAPCLNEENNVEVLYDRLKRACAARGIDFELVLIDDGSTDNTWRKCLELKDRFPLNVVTAQHDTNLGIPQAWRTGLDNAQGEYVCLIDSDLQNPPESVVNLHEVLLKTKCDFVRGVRIPSHNDHPLRRIMSKLLNHLLNVSFGMKSKDNKSGFIIGSKQEMIRIIDHSGKYRYFQTFIGVSAHYWGYSVIELPTPFHRRHSGTSFLNGKSIAVIFDVLSDIKVAREEFSPRHRQGNE